MTICIPGDIDNIFDKPGRDWTPDERLRVVVWLNSEPQLRYLLGIGCLHLGYCAQREDAEDAWNEFCLRRLNRVIDSYDPAKGRFWDYLKVCFKRFCHDEAKKLRPVVVRDDREDDAFVIEFVDQNEDVERRLERKETQLFLLRCVNQLPSDFRSVVILFYFQEMSVKEIAKELGISESNARQRTRRARAMLAERLRYLWEATS